MVGGGTVACLPRIFAAVFFGAKARAPFFRPFGAGSSGKQETHGLRRGLHSFAAWRLFSGANSDGSAIAGLVIVVKKREDVVVREPFSSLQEIQFNDKRQAGDLSAEALG